MQSSAKMPLQDGDGPVSKAAIAGLACRLPMSHNIQEFWEKLMDGVDMISSTRWPEGLYGLPPRAGFIPDVDKFDSTFFEFSDLQVNNTNPLLLHLMEVIYECIVDSGLQLHELQNASTGLYLACFLSDFDAVETSRCATSGRLSMSSCLAGCVTQWFGLSGPMVTVDTACSSSISALHMAVIDILIGKCKYAIVAGANLILNPVFLQQMLFLNMLSPQGTSRVFDKDADGYVRAEGIASILLTRSPDDCKRVYATIVNVGVNCDGYVSEGITFPNQHAQSELLKTLYDESGLTGEDLAYLEGHSTGTQAGDKTEVAALEVLYGCRKTPLLIGAVKSNIGHTEATAGLAGMLKCILIAQHHMIPPNLNFNEMNPKIEAILSGKIKVVDKPTPLPDGFIGVNSFGFGGVNAHVILQPFHKEVKRQDNYPVLIPLKLRNFEAIPSIQKFIAKHIEETDLLHMMSQSMISHDEMQPLRAYVVTNGTQNDDCVRTCFTPDVVEIGPPLSIWLMIDDLLLDDITVSPNLLKNKCFLKSLEMSQKVLSSLDSEIVLHEIIENATSIVPGSTDWICVGISVLLGLVDCIMAAGVQVSGVVGSGLSEIVAAYLDFCLDRTQCIQIAHAINRTIIETNTAKKIHLYYVNLQSDQAFRLGPKVQILAILSFERFVIAVSEPNRERVLRNIHRKGGHYELIAAEFLMYSSSSFNLEKLKSELKLIVPSPKAWSVRMISGKAGPQYFDGEKMDATFIADLLNTRVELTSALQIISLKSCLLRVSLAPHFAACASRSPRKPCWENLPNWHEQSLFCHASLESLYQTLGEIHLLGHNIDHSSFCDVQYPLGCEAASFSPLVHWDHTVNWHLPQWPEFSCRVKDDTIHPYTIFHCELEGIHTPMAPLIYHTWTAVCQRLHPEEDDVTLAMLAMLERNLKSDDAAFIPMILSDMIAHVDDLMECENLAGSVIQVHTSRKQFTVVKKGVVLLSGKYMEMENGLDLPCVPGYDLDINQNVEQVNEQCDYTIEKAEILWEDSWLEFLNSVIEFASQFMDGGIYQILIDPKRHADDVKDCANILAVVEMHTGLCKAGSVVCQFHNANIPQSSESFSQKSLVSKGHGDTMVAKVIVYSFHGDEDDTEKLMVYTGFNPVLQKDVVGLVLIKGQKFTTTEIVMKEERDDEIDMLVPYLISSYILYDVAKVEDGDKLLMLPPLDTVAVYVLALADQLGCCVFTSSWDIEIHQLVESVFPSVHCLPGKNLMPNISSLTQGEQCDICIRLTGGDMYDAVDLVTEHGMFIQCIPPPQEKMVGMNMMLKNNMVTILEPAFAMQEFFKKSAEDQKTLLYNMRCDGILKLLEEGFPESSGILYRRDEKVKFAHAMKLQRLLSLLDEPGLNANTHCAEMSETDSVSMKRLQNIISDKPKDYSIAELEMVDSYCSEIHSVNKLNMAMAQTPSSAWNSLGILEFQTPQIYVGTMTDEAPFECSTEKKTLVKTMPQIIKVGNEKFGKRASSTSVITILLPEDDPDGNKAGEISDDARDESIGSKDEMDLIKRKKKRLLSRLRIPKQNRVDLLMCGPPPTPLTPDLKEMLTPKVVEPNIILLNGISHNERPLFIVHPISGNLLLLESLGKLVNTQCFGIKKTAVTPKSSIESIASYYINAMVMFQRRGPYRIAGYSYGCTIALEMALKLQAIKKEVECLVCLDGSPDYFYHQIAEGKALAPPGASQKQLDSFVEVGSLLEFMKMYKPVTHQHLLHGVLLKLPTLEAQIQMAVDITTGHVIVSLHPKKNHWQFLREKVKDKSINILKTEQKPTLFNAAVEVIRLKRKEKAEDFVNSVHIVNNYRPASEGKKFNGDIHLLRIKSELPHCRSLPTDYGLYKLCTGRVYVKFYGGDHETFISGDNVQSVADDVNRVLASLSAG